MHECKISINVARVHIVGTELIYDHTVAHKHKALVQLLTGEALLLEGGLLVTLQLVEGARVAARVERRELLVLQLLLDAVVLAA